MADNPAVASDLLEAGVALERPIRSHPVAVGCPAGPRDPGRMDELG
jgi:hypothetical protein